VKAAHIIVGLREMTDAAMTQPLLIEHLIHKEINGKDYLDAIKAQDRHAIILLKS
jgi:hypothetical protein